jgi:hypothetical protein
LASGTRRKKPPEWPHDWYHIDRVMDQAYDFESEYVPQLPRWLADQLIDLTENDEAEALAFAAELRRQ